jgi:hypothetical protein
MENKMEINNEIEEMKKEVEKLEELKQELKKTKKERTKKIKKTEDEVKLRKCKLCGENKTEDKFVVDRKLADGKIRFKTKCLDCYKEISKKYYQEKRDKILDDMNKINDKKKKQFAYNLKFNNLEDLTKQVELLKEKFNNKEVLEIKKEYKPRKRKDFGGNGGPNSPPATDNI